MDMNLVALSAALTNWNSNVFGHVGKRKQALLAQIRGIDRYLTRCQWITKDLNTYYFRNQAKRRQKANSIFTLRREDNSWCTDQNELLGIAVSHFVSLFTSIGGMGYNYNFQVILQV
ncbi:hypothetical protein V6N12_009228 [Hibiscus sabdariffa]|uniref:Uncharacterized protein n=1 Tax=Hibiscus sabdariffa TaxID=183260 RepID=A0ABR2BID1_9ROSI